MTKYDFAAELEKLLIKEVARGKKLSEQLEASEAVCRAAWEWMQKAEGFSKMTSKDYGAKLSEEVFAASDRMQQAIHAWRKGYVSEPRHAEP